jgi:hypothetical protein
VLELQRPIGGTSALAFSRDGSRIATADADTAIRVYDTRAGKISPPNTDFLLEPLALAFTADGKQLVTGGDKVMASLDVASGKLIRKSGKLDDPVAALDISPDGTLVAAMLLHADNMLLPGLVIVSETASGQGAPSRRRFMGVFPGATRNGEQRAAEHSGGGESLEPAARAAAPPREDKHEHRGAEREPHAPGGVTVATEGHCRRANRCRQRQHNAGRFHVRA